MKAERVVEKVGDVKIYGTGSAGGKGAGLISINESNLPQAHKLRTRILTTTFYDRFIANNSEIEGHDAEVIAKILLKLGNIPISVRSSATNEACISLDGKGSVRAGENTSFMLPNNHPDFVVRLAQLKQAVGFIYSDFKKKQSPESREKMAIVINPIPGISRGSLAGPVYFPLISGVANSYFPYALKSQASDEGFARLAFGHGYATVLDDFPVISMATIKNPIPLRFLGEGQKYFYAIDMTKNSELVGNELETMRRLHSRFADQDRLKLLGRRKSLITLEEIVQNDRFGFRSGLLEIMEKISSKMRSHFQIEFVFNIGGLGEQEGTFHVVQLTPLPKIIYKKIDFPERLDKVYLSISNLQGHGIKRKIKHAIVVSPFIYKKDMHDQVKTELSEMVQKIQAQGEKYIIIVPGRLGSTNRDWGIQVEYLDIGNPEAIFEYGVDISGRPEPVQETLTAGGIYGSHFLYMIQGGFDEEQRRLQTRMFGTQGTHFLTNLMGNNVVYGYIAPMEDIIDPWFFSPPEENKAVYTLAFPRPISIFADSRKQRCVVMEK